MPITIGSNIASLNAQRRLSEGTASLSSTFEKLSSGQRINKASDDAAGLAIAASLNSDKRVFTQGIRNLNDGVSLLNIADSAVENLSSIVIRLKELAEQSANGTFGVQQRKSLDAEAQALSEEYLRISQSTTFNGRALFTGSLGELRLQAGYGIDGSVASGLGGAIGTGTFGAAATFQQEANYSYAIELGDLNGDGILDVVSVGLGAGLAVSTVRLGTGDGTFGTAVSYQMESTSSASIALGDLNGDGVLDMVSAGQSAGTGRATVRLGNGNGTFGNAVSYLTEGDYSTDVTLGDLNGDGVLDMVSSDAEGAIGRTTVRLGLGNGSFGGAVSYLTESTGSYSVTLGDLNGDGVLDMVSSGSDGVTGTATVRLGSGNGTFGTAVTYQTDTSASYSITLGDLNGDGFLDMVSAGDSGGLGSATVRLGTGSGTFGSAVSYQMNASYSYSITLGDLNGDGVLDMIGGGGSFLLGDASVRFGTGNGTFGAANTLNTGNTVAYGLATGDINGDGVLDLVTTGYSYHSYLSESSVFLSNTKSGVSPLLPFDLSTQAGALQALPVFGQKLDQLAKQRGTIGAFQSRIDVATSNLQVSAENFAAAASRITDVDVADESSRLIRLNILQQASASVLAQANLQPQLALQLLN